MKPALVFIAFVFALTSTEAQSKKSYKDHKVVSLRIENEVQLKELQSLELAAGVREPSILYHQTSQQPDFLII